MSRPPTAAGLLALRSFLEDLENATAIATTLAREGHPIDLDGFAGQIGLLCAKALDLPLEQGLTMRPALLRLREKLETLEHSLPRPEDLFRPP